MAASDYPRFSGDGADRLRENGRRIVVIGAGGWIGMATLEGLRHCLGADFDRRVVCFGSSARRLQFRGGWGVDQAPLARLRDLPPEPSYVLQLAFLTQEKAKIMPETEYVAINRAISREVVDALDPIGVRGVFAPSSGAAYLVDDERASASMRLYGRLKIDDEDLFGSWADRGGTTAVIARVFNLAGPYINKQSSYALACFIADAVAGRPIAIKASHPVFRSFVSVTEMMSVVFGLLTEERPGVTRFDTAGDRNLEMAAIAEVVRTEVAPGCQINRPELSGAAADRYLGNRSVYAALRDRLNVERVEFAEQVRQTARFMALASKNASSAPNGA